MGGYLAVRLSYECALLGGDQQYRTLDPAPEPTTPTARDRANHLVRFWEFAGVTEGELGAAARVLAALPVAARDMLWQNAFEESYRNRLLSTLHVERHGSSASAHTQLVTCIDTRSEGLRRHLESLGGYETLGFAGFFAVAIRFTDLLGGAASDLCPVLIAPNYDITEAPSRHGVEYAARRISGALDLAGAESAFHAAKEALAAPFTLAEVAGGWVAGPLSTIKTLTPGLAGALRHRLHRWAVPPQAPTVLNVDAIPLAERALFAQVALTTMGAGQRVRPAGSAVRSRQFYREQPVSGRAGMRSVRRTGGRPQCPHRRGDPERTAGTRGTAQRGYRHPGVDVFL